MEFKDFKKALQKQFKAMTKNNNKLFLTDVDKNEMWEYYLDSFPDDTNPIFKERREYDCNSCKQFIRPYGNVVTIDDNNELVSIWDFVVPQGFDISENHISNENDYIKDAYQTVADAMSKFVKSQPIKNVFITKFKDLGVDSNKQLLEDGKVKTWDHFYFKINDNYVNDALDSVEAMQAPYRDSKNVFERSMKELTLDSGKVILELIEQGSLYKGDEHKNNIRVFIAFKKEFDEVVDVDKDNWCWINSFNNSIVRVRNTALGTLLVDLSKDVDVDIAVKKFEKIMAPENYKRPKPIYTKKMIEDAHKKVVDMGFENSLSRRFAQLDDITVNNILFANRDAKKSLKGNVFDELKESIPVNTKKFDKVEEISIEDFIKNILPTTTNIELMVENKHNNNFMSLIAPGDKEAPSMFKWSNPFSWSYNGDITDSSIKRNVKSAGGNVEGVLRFSIQWNDNRDNSNDFDAHCKEPSGNLISYQNMKNVSTSGVLDVDITQPMEQRPNGPAVENIVHTDINKMQEGNYEYGVHCYSHNGGRTGFSAEIEYDGQIYSFNYDKELRQGEYVSVSKINFNKVSGVKFIKSLDSSVSSKELWGLKTNTFTKVNLMMYSPNFWDDQKGIGNKHYFFLIDGCKNEASPRGFYNEFLNDKLTENRKVFEALGSKFRVEDSDNQLSGVGFSSTQRNSIKVKVEGSISRVIKINF